MPKKSRVAEAFSEGFNMVSLAGAAALSAALLNPVPLLIGVVAEAAYLLFIPDSRWFSARLERRYDAEVKAHRDKLRAKTFPLLADRTRNRFLRLESIRVEVEAHPAVADEKWFREVCRKLDYLLEKFLLFAQKEAEFLRYLDSVYEEVLAGPPRPKVNDRRGERRERIDPPITDSSKVQRMVEAIQQRFDADIEEVDEARLKEEAPNTKAVLDKRREVLGQRREYVGRIGRILTNLNHQMQLLEDTFGLINDQIRARSPEQVLADIEGVVYQTDAMTNLLEELSELDRL